ncbi:MAG: triple tyrosine motif-containing protein [Clostridium sp.]|uniref:triple tyrosine motif-containing protein n=1 Tax=Clostridium sp. TaxID=1506 RepID=UPI003EE580BA
MIKIPTKINLIFNKKSPQRVDSSIEIKIECDAIIDYKVLVGNDGIWNTIKEFDDPEECVWTPKEEGEYMIMVQGRSRNSEKPYDLIEKEPFIIKNGRRKKDLLKEIILDKEEYIEGDRIKVTGISEESDILYRFWKKGKKGWEALRDYGKDTYIQYTALNFGEEEILVECKRMESREAFDDFKTIKFKIKKKEKLEITGFRCLTEERLVDRELVFKVQASKNTNRALLFKFIKIDSEGHSVCIQDFSSRQIVTYQEVKPGDYKILCLMKDILSHKEYDDRAMMHYKVRPYNKIKINKFEADVRSPQKTETDIKFRVDAEGGREKVYRYIIDGIVSDDSCYTRSTEYVWIPKEEGRYKVTIYAKDISFKGDYEDKKSMIFEIDKRGDRPIRIADIITDTNRETIVNKPINLRVLAEGGTSLTYAFKIFKDGKELEAIKFNRSNYINFTPTEKGKYEVDVKVKDKYTNAEYDVQTSYFVTVRDYLPGSIEHILIPKREHYLINETIDIEAIVQDTKNTLINIVTKINGNIVEETGFMPNKRICIKPKCAGRYGFEIYAKNVKCEKEFDSKKEIAIYVEEATPVIGTKVIVTESLVGDNKEITFKATSIGGKDVCYEFYIMEKGNWVKAQRYSKKNYYTFIPYNEGIFRVLVLAKSYYKRVNYEDYCEIEFTV